MRLSVRVVMLEAIVLSPQLISFYCVLIFNESLLYYLIILYIFNRNVGCKLQLYA